MEEILQKLIQDFEKAPASSSRQMRELLEADRKQFVPAALATLRQPAENRGYRYLIALLAGNDLLVRCVCDRSLSLPTAVTLARIGMQMDPALDTALARAVMASEGGRAEAEAVRTLDILGEVSDGTRLVPVLTQLLQHPGPRVRSKAALLIARRNKSSRWVEQRWGETDPRVRANLLEGLWGIDGEGPRHMLREACRDPNNRVAGNALLGLHRIGDTRSIVLCMDMAAHADPRFRATAAWMMGESGDPRFMPALGRMMTDDSQMVRARAFRSLARIRKRIAAVESAGRLGVYVHEACRLADGIHRVRVAVMDAAGGDTVAALPPTAFVVWEDGQPVFSYDVNRRPAPAMVSVGFGLPRRPSAALTRAEETLLECLKQKRPNDQWAITSYSAEPALPGAEQAIGAVPHFFSKAAMLKAQIEKPVSRAEAVTGLAEAARLLLAGAATLAGERHLVLIGAPGDEPAPDLDVVRGRARHNGIVVHGLALAGGGMPVLEALATATGGRLMRVEREEELRGVLLRLLCGLHYQHEIQYRLESANEQPHPLLKVQVWSDLGGAEDMVPLD
jgi:HEAT repeat protein